MISINKSMFFDRNAVMSKVDAATRKVLSKFGSFVRTAAKSSIRKRKRISRPGDPPSSHTGLLRKFIWFGYDDAARSVVIGPAPLNGRSSRGAPELLEYGGRGSAGTYAPRPYMRPAFEREKARLPGLWANSVKK